MVGLTLIASVCYVAIKTGLQYAPPLYFGGLRAMIAGIALLGFAAALRLPVLPPRDLWRERLGTGMTMMREMMQGGMPGMMERMGPGMMPQDQHPTDHPPRP